MIGRKRAHRDPVTPELIEALFRRDLGCILSFLAPGHVCRNRWGEVADWNDPRALTVEHVHEGYGMKGRRAASDLDHTVLLCFGANVGVPTKTERVLIREYIAQRRAA